MTGTVLPEIDFTSAKAHLSDVVSSVVNGHRPHLVSRHRGKESVLMVRTDDLAAFLDAYRFEPRVVIDRADDGTVEITAELERFGVAGFGGTLDEALDDLVTELRAYAQRFFERHTFYRQTDRAGDGPWLLRFAATPADRQSTLLRDDMDAAALDARRAAGLPTAE